MVSPNPNPSDSTNQSMGGAIYIKRDDIISPDLSPSAILYIIVISEREASLNNRGLISRSLRKNLNDNFTAPKETKIRRDTLLITRSF